MKMNRKDITGLPKISKRDLSNRVHYTLRCPFHVRSREDHKCIHCKTFFPGILKENIRQGCPCTVLNSKYVVKKVIRLMKEYPELLEE